MSARQFRGKYLTTRGKHLTMVVLATVLMQQLWSAQQGWLKLETQRFEIVFEAQDESQARHLASFADEVFDHVSSLLDHRPQRRIPVVIAGRTAFANGSFSPFPPSITIFTTSPGDRSLGPRSPDWLRTVFVHELTHYLHLTTPRGLTAVATKLFGPDAVALSTPFMGGWWIEGITTYAESSLAIGGRGDDTRFELNYNAPILADTMWSLAQGSYQSARAPSGRIYVTGYMFVDYLMQRYGQDSFAAVNNEFLRWPFFGLDPALQKITGKKGHELFHDAIEALRFSFAPAPAATPSTPFAPFDEGDQYLPVAIRDGWLGLVRTPSTGVALVRYDGEGTISTIVTRPSVSDSLSFDATDDGSTCLVASPWSDPFDPYAIATADVTYSDLYLYRITTDSWQRLTIGKRLIQGAISGDGSIVVAIERSGTRYRLVRIHIESGTCETLLELPDGSVYEPHFNATGDAVVVVAVRNGLSALMKVALDQTVQQLTPFATPAIYRPRFTASGDILFSSDKNGGLALYRLDRENATIALVLEDPVGIIAAEQRSDQLVYLTYTDHGHALRQIAVSDLSEQVVDWGMEAVVPTDEELGFLLASTAYRDHLRMGLWLPVPLEDGQSVAAGAMLLMRSLLGRHTLALAAGWSFADNLPVFNASYSWWRGGLDLTFAGELNTPYLSSEPAQWQRLHAASATMAIALATYDRPDYRSRLEGNLSMALVNLDQVATVATTSIGLGFVTATPSSHLAYFGRSRASASSALHILLNTVDMEWEFQPALHVEGQLALGNSGQIVAAEIDAIATSDELLDRYTLLPKGNVAWGVPKQGKAKARLTTTWGFPLGLWDIPVPFGGLTAMGGLLFAQTAVLADATGLTWEEDVYVGAELHADFTIHSTVMMQPSIGVVFRVSDGKWRVYVDTDLPIGFFSDSDKLNTAPPASLPTVQRSARNQ